MLFARPFAAETLPEGDARKILDNVRTAVAFARAERRIRPSRRRIAGAAAAAAAFGALLLMAPGSRNGRVETQVAALQSGEAPPTPAAVNPALELSAPPETSLFPSLVQPAALETEGISSDATVYDWNPGAGREEPRVVWIVDRGLDI
jgi:hypothetical protein